MWNKKIKPLGTLLLMVLLCALPLYSQEDTVQLLGDMTPAMRDSIIVSVPGDTSSSPDWSRFGAPLHEKYSNDSAFDYERKMGKSLFKRFEEWLSSWLDRLFGKPNTSQINRLSENVLHVLLVLFFLAAVYITIRLLMNHRGRWFFEKKPEAVAVDLNNVEKHIHEADFAALLKEAELRGDTRQSVRLLYLWVLKTFSDSRIIRWNPDKTNIDYLSEIADDVLREQFRYLSYLYNYIWYGEFSIDDADYQDARKTFFRHIKTNRNDE